MSLILAEVAQDFGWFVGDTLLTKGLLVEYSASDINVSQRLTTCCEIATFYSSTSSQNSRPHIHLF